MSVWQIYYKEIFLYCIQKKHSPSRARCAVEKKDSQYRERALGGLLSPCVASGSLRAVGSLFS